MASTSSQEEKIVGHADSSAILGLPQSQRATNYCEFYKCVGARCGHVHVCLRKDTHNCIKKHVSACNNYNCKDLKCTNYHPKYCKNGTHCVVSECKYWHLDTTLPICSSIFMPGNNLKCNFPGCIYSHEFNSVAATVKNVVIRNLKDDICSLAVLKAIGIITKTCGPRCKYAHDTTKVGGLIDIVAVELEKCNLAIGKIGQISFLNGASGGKARKIYENSFRFKNQRGNTRRANKLEIESEAKRDDVEEVDGNNTENTQSSD
jgi:hypothetical protein